MQSAVRNLQRNYNKTHNLFMGGVVDIALIIRYYDIDNPS